MALAHASCFDDPEFGLDMMDEEVGYVPDECGFPSPPPVLEDVVPDVSLPPVADVPPPVLPESQTPDGPPAMADAEPVAA